ncbi:DVU3141 family protein [Oceanimonas marisflavi]|uniref:DVU3141 family protein n=1 Tax=Oceanimonas marisflavi TaxID=2059724 RepID=UPI001E44D253|nr:DVU3141 family protein [Oceanimonas marisflavi]
MALILQALSGCTSHPVSSEISSPSGHTPLGHFLESATGEAVTTLPASLWGTNARVTTGPSYFAASGRTCRPVQVTRPTGTQEAYIACKAQNGEWQLSRPFGSHKL